MILFVPTFIAVGICACIAYIPLLIWRFIRKKQTGPTFLHYSVIMLCLITGFGIIGLFGGIFAPVAFMPDSPQAPIIGIFITGPLGALTGVLGSWIWFYVKRLKINH